MKPLILIFYDNYAIIYKIINYGFQYKGTNMKKKRQIIIISPLLITDIAHTLKMKQV